MGPNVDGLVVEVPDRFQEQDVGVGGFCGKMSVFFRSRYLSSIGEDHGS